MWAIFTDLHSTEKYFRPRGKSILLKNRHELIYALTIKICVESHIVPI